MTYDYLYPPSVVTETVVDVAGATQTRATTTTFENGGLGLRPVRSATSGTVGTAVPAVVTTYDSTTGLATTLATDTTPVPGPGMAGTITTGFDDFGQVTTTTENPVAVALGAALGIFGEMLTIWAMRLPL